MRPDLETGEENPYEFIFGKDGNQTPQNDGKQPLRNPLTKQNIIFGIFAAAVLLVAGIVAVIAFSKDPPTAPELVRVRSYQAEIARVTEIGDSNVGNFDLRKDVDNLNITISTDAIRISQLIAAREVVATQAAYAQTQDTSRDTRLAQSLNVDRHDAVYREIVNELVTGYYNSVKAAETASLSANERSHLALIRKNIEIIYLDEPTEATPVQQTPVEQEPTPTLTN